VSPIDPRGAREEFTPAHPRRDCNNISHSDQNNNNNDNTRELLQTIERLKEEAMRQRQEIDSCKRKQEAAENKARDETKQREALFGDLVNSRALHRHTKEKYRQLKADMKELQKRFYEKDDVISELINEKLKMEVVFRELITRQIEHEKKTQKAAAQQELAQVTERSLDQQQQQHQQAQYPVERAASPIDRRNKETTTATAGFTVSGNNRATGTPPLLQRSKTTTLMQSLPPQQRSLSPPPQQSQRSFSPPPQQQQRSLSPSPQQQPQPKSITKSIRAVAQEQQDKLQRSAPIYAPLRRSGTFSEGMKNPIVASASLPNVPGNS